jgi:outer membrane lipoprotein-sorting protein
MMCRLHLGRFKMTLRPLLFPIILASVLAANAQAELKTAEEIDACFRENQPEDSAVQTISMNSKDRIGAVTTTKAKMYWKKFDDGYSRVMMKFFKPAEMRGAGLLMVEKKDRNDMLLYLPELGRVKRVTKHMTSASMFGTDFSYEEFERVQGIAEDAPSERLEDANVEDRAAYVLLSHPKPEEESAYERIKTWIDKETCVALRAEFYERGEKPRKVMTASPTKVTKEGAFWVPHEILMRDHRDETETVMLVEEVEVDAKIPRKMFSERELVSGGR